MDIQAALLLADIDRSTQDARFGVKCLSSPTAPLDRRVATMAIHEAITRAEDDLRALRELYPIPNAE